MRALLDAGFLHGDCITVTGKTLAENLKDVPSIYSEQAKRGAAAEQADARYRAHRHPARQPRAGRRRRQGRGLEGQQDHRPRQSLRRRGSVLRGHSEQRQIKAGDVVVIRGEGPVGGPGMREMLSVTGALSVRAWATASA